MKALAGCVLLAGAAAAGPPPGLTDPTRYLKEEAYQPAPRRLAEWEEGQINLPRVKAERLTSLQPHSQSCGSESVRPIAPQSD